MFKAIQLQQSEQGTQAQVVSLNESDLPEADVQLDVLASTLNYKDGLAITGAAPVVRQWPMVPGIDLVGRVTNSASERFKSGDLVLLNGFGVGETHWGGLAEKASLKADWLIALPDGISPTDAMAVGTAGYTAMLCVLAIEKHGITPDKGEVLVTGAAGGVGSFAITLLNKLGYQVVASTGRAEEADYLKGLGASEVIDRASLSEKGKPLQRERWAAVVDCVGSHTLANACAATQYGGAVAACGLAQGMDFPSSVAPFILRGVTLYGIDSVMRPLADREQAWQRLAELLEAKDLADISRTISLDEAIGVAKDLLSNKVRGRVVVKIAD
ncbi:MDR family oxidoreductase [Paraferrimonas sedimenticola]|uniref:Alcohol dehydrogenase n=1 Tax=Paraferrimonas sedimenticola TaxID=375674 RepID=A0AA37RTA8_9GAMM|nr:MDR family oxidoreductase [Paraferrimonas sedimenticola]GLP95505.1 alcohol dehydrogenase [Paraferrimonas sedimenticola]